MGSSTHLASVDSGLWQKANHYRHRLRLYLQFFGLSRHRRDVVLRASRAAAVADVPIADVGHGRAGVAMLFASG